MMRYSDHDEPRRGVVAITNLFPNQHEPRRGLFNLRQLEALARLVPVTTVAPVAYFPLVSALRRLASSGRARDLPQRGRVEGLEVTYPRYFYPPAVGRPVQGHLYYHGVRSAVARAVREVGAAVLYGTWAYPDGFAVTKLAERLGMPCVIKVHGSDVNEYMKTAWRRRVIVSTLNRASKVVSVSEALRRRMIECGVGEERINVIYNGVDREVFKVMEREDAKARLGLDGAAPRLLFVGNLKPVKGLNDLIAAMRRVVDTDSRAQLHIIGYGPLEPSLRRSVREASLGGNVHFEGEKDPGEIAVWMSACDLLCLPSLNEGVPNVILEALSCGLPVVATRVGGIPEVVPSEEAGLLVDPGNPPQLHEAIARALQSRWVRADVSRFADRYSWDSNARSLLSTLQSAAS